MNYEAIAEWSQIISAAVFVVAMIWIWMRFIAPAVLSAQQRTNQQIADTERHRDEAKAALETLRGEIDGATRDAQTMKERAQAQAQREREATRREAQEAGDRALRQAGGELDRSRAAAREQLRTELLGKALDLARSQASARVDAAVNGQIVDSFLTTLERGGLN